ncbi:MAG TPA: prolyl oligopeptidase family serine peptidase [Flavitalea sp.]|nr:prolyl oligopeptidase family serine peptidase [Flavitalea sp.]
MNVLPEIRKKSILLIFALCSLSTNAQLLSDSFEIDNHHRTFHFKKPSLASTKSSLVFVLHGSGGSGRGIMNLAAKLDAIAERENIIMVYPDGYKNYWNECRKSASSIANIENIDDNTFFDRMIEYFILKYQVNPEQVFAIGTSGGGHMAYKLAMTSPQKFKAITAIIANLPDTGNMDCGESRIPISVMIINGTSDSTNPYHGGEVRTSQATFGKVRSTDRTFAYWAALNGYTGKARKEKLPDTDPADGKTIERFTYSKKGKSEVVLLKVINGKHDYPNDIDVYLEAWNFFKRQIQ